MHIQSFKSIAVALVAAVLVTGTALADDAPAKASKWRVDFIGQASSDGEMQFRVTPHAGEPILVTTRIHSGCGQMCLAQGVRESFKNQLPKGHFRAEVLENDRLLLKALPGEEAFLLELVESSVEGSRIRVKVG
jgi:hypothetical protein